MVRLSKMLLGLCLFLNMIKFLVQLLVDKVEKRKEYNIMKISRRMIILIYFYCISLRIKQGINVILYFLLLACLLFPLFSDNFDILFLHFLMNQTKH